jgi:perosamine synthetase
MSIHKKYLHVDLGYNYRMTNMQAAVGLAQLEQLDKILEVRKRQMDFYYKLLINSAGIQLRQFAEWTEPVHWLMTITLDARYNREDFLDYMRTKDIDCRQMINPVNHAKHLVDLYRSEDFSAADNTSKQSVHLPSSTSLSNCQIESICKNINIFLSILPSKTRGAAPQVI